ncbi:MAG: hypothetical protein AB7S69_16745 [Salinivirgaceae bacterium]
MRFKRKLLIIIGLLIGILSITWLIINTFRNRYDIIDINSAFKMTNTMESSFSPKNLDKTLFVDFVNKIKQNDILNISSEINEIDTNHYFVRGIKKFKKPFFYRIISFNYWYLVFEIEGVNYQINVESRWYEGNEEGPINKQNYTPKPTESIKIKEKEIHSLLEVLTKEIK